MRKLSRLLYLINYLSARYGVSAVDLATACGVSKRTIYRDIQDIHRAGFPIYYLDGYRVSRPGAMPPGNFTADELKALMNVIEEKKNGNSSLYFDLLQSIEIKMKRAIAEFEEFQIVPDKESFALSRRV